MSALLGDLLLRVGADLVSWDALKDNLTKTQERVQAFADSISGIGATLGTAFDAGIAGALLHFGEDFDEATRNIISRTGAIGDSLAGFQTSFKNVFATVDESAGDVSKTMTELASRLGLVGQPLEDLTKTMLDLAKVAQEDVVPLTQATAKAFAEWQLSTNEQKAALEDLMRVSQASGARITELVSDLQQFAPALKGLGLSFEQAAGLIGQFVKAGIDVGPAMSSLQKGLLTLSKAGLADPLAGLQELAKEIRGANTEGEAFQIGAQAFGKGATVIVEAIRSGKIDLDNFNGTLKLSTNTIAQTAQSMETIGDKLGQLWNQIKVAVEPAATAFVQAAKDMIDGAKPLVDWIGSLAKGFSELSPMAQKAVIDVGLLAGAVGPLMVALKLGSNALAAFIGLIPDLSGASKLAIEEMVGLNTAFLTFKSTIAAEGLAGGLNAINAAFAELGPVLTTVAGAAVLAAGAFAGWKLGTWLYDNVEALHKFGDAVADLLLKIPGLETAIGKLATPNLVAPTQDLAAKVKDVETWVRSMGVAVSQGNMTLTQYASHLAEVKASLGGYEDAQKKAADAAELSRQRLLAAAQAAQEAAKQFAEWQKKFLDLVTQLQQLPQSMDDFRDAALDGTLKVNEQLDKMRAEITDAQGKYGQMSAAGQQAFRDLVSAFLKFRDEANQLSFEKLLVQFRQLDDESQGVFDRMQGPIKDYVDSLRRAADANSAALDQIAMSGKGAIEMLSSLAKAQLAAEASSREVFATMQKAVADYNTATKTALNDSIKAFEDASKGGHDLATRLNPDLLAIVNNVKLMDEGFKAFGITSTAQLDASAKKAQEFYDAMVKGGASTRDLLEAQLALITAEIAATQAHGQSVADLQQRYLDVTHQLQDMGFVQKQIIDYGAAFDQVFTKAWDDFDSGIAEAIVSGQSLGDVFTKVLKEIAQSILTLVVKAITVDLQNALLGTAGQVTNLEKAFSSLGSSITKIFGTGSSAVAGAGKAAGGADNATGALGSVSSALSVIGIAVDALSGIVNGLQNARMENTLNAIELNTRRTDVTLEGPDGIMEHVKGARIAVDLLGESFNGWFHDSFASLMSTTEEMRDTLKDLSFTVVSGGGDDAGLADEIAKLKEALGADDAIIDSLRRTIAQLGVAGDTASDTAGDIAQTSDAWATSAGAYSDSLDSLSSTVKDSGFTLDETSTAVSNLSTAATGLATAAQVTGAAIDNVVTDLPRAALVAQATIDSVLQGAAAASTNYGAFVSQALESYGGAAPPSSSPAAPTAPADLPRTALIGWAGVTPQTAPPSTSTTVVVNMTGNTISTDDAADQILDKAVQKIQAAVRPY